MREAQDQSEQMDIEGIVYNSGSNNNSRCYKHNFLTCRNGFNYGYTGSKHMAWEGISDTARHIIYVGAVAGALTTIAAFYRWVYPPIKSVAEKIRWIMSDENDHAIIMSRLNQIQGMLEPNGGTSIADSLNRIEHTVTFLGARQLASLHTNDNPVFETDEKGEVIFVNNSYKKIFGIDSHDAEGMGWVNIIDPKHRDDVVTKWFRAVQDNRTFDEYLPLKGANGKAINTHVVAYVIRGEQDRMLGHHGEVTIIE